jgi:sulfur dioxygenase
VNLKPIQKEQINMPPATTPSTTSLVKRLEDILMPNEPVPTSDWQMRVVVNQECLSYVVWNEKSAEAILIDPKEEETETYLALAKKLPDVQWLAVVDTHTHADHISSAATLAQNLQVPLIMHQLSGSTRPHLRICQQTTYPSRAQAIRFIPSAGHTQDAVCVSWGPFVFTGDTVLYGDVGRDDLPSGDSAAHYDSLQHLRKELRPEQLICPGHDSKGGRIISWGTQLKINSSITQPREDYIRECSEFDAPAPALLKKALFQNLK